MILLIYLLYSFYKTSLCRLFYLKHNNRLITMDILEYRFFIICFGLYYISYVVKTQPSGSPDYKNTEPFGHTLKTKLI